MMNDSCILAVVLKESDLMRNFRFKDTRSLLRGGILSMSK